MISTTCTIKVVSRHARCSRPRSSFMCLSWAFKLASFLFMSFRSATIRSTFPPGSAMLASTFGNGCCGSRQRAGQTQPQQVCQSRGSFEPRICACKLKDNVPGPRVLCIARAATYFRSAPPHIKRQLILFEIYVNTRKRPKNCAAILYRDPCLAVGNEFVGD